MIPLLGGLGAAIAFTVSTLASARSSRLIGGPSTLSGVMGIGLLVALPFALVASPAPALGGGAIWWAAVAGGGNVGGLLLVYAAYRIGAVGLIAVVVSTEGAIAALISVLTGEVLASGTAGALLVTALGVAMAAAGSGQEVEEGMRIPRRRSIETVALALGAALLFGVGLYAGGRLGGLLPTAWAVLPARLIGTAVAILLLLLGRLRFTRAALPWVAVTALAEILGYASYVTGARDGIAITAVVATLFAPIAAVAAFVLFRERLGRQQVAGIVVVVVGVTVLGALQG